MGMNAVLMVIGKYSVLEKWDALEYSTDFYDDVLDDTKVVGTICVMETTSYSQELAELLGIEPWNFNKHQISNYINIPKGWMEDEYKDLDAEKIIRTINGILKDDPDALIFYCPNG